MKIHQVVLFTLINSILAVPASNDGKRLIKLDEHSPAIQLTESQVITQLVQKNKNFFDITEVGEASTRSLAPAFNVSLPTSFRYQSRVRTLFDKIDVSNAKSFLEKYSSFHNRYYKAATGAEASDWLFEHIKELLITSKYKGIVEVDNVKHAFPQQSIIVRIEGADKKARSEIVAVGAHLDSVNGKDPFNGRAPGVDDDGTGTAANLETLRIILTNNFIPKRSIEFHWYAGEEGGLLGSQDIAKSYSEGSQKVVSVVQFDMVGHLSPDKKIGIVTDYTDAELNQFLRNAITEYSNYQWVDKKCGYACSDHASWNKYGFKSAFPHEDKSNRNIHTVNDTLEFVNFDHVREFIKLSLAYLVEVAEVGK